MKNISYLSRAIGIMLRLSFLVVIVGFGVCSNQLHALKIKNGLEKDLEVIFILESKDPNKVGEYKFVGIPENGKVIKPGETIEIKNIVRPFRNAALGNKMAEAAFKNLKIMVRYEEKLRTIDVGNLSQNNIKNLKAGHIGILFKIPTSELSMADAYFNKRGDWRTLNARLYDTTEYQQEG